MRGRRLFDGFFFGGCGSTNLKVGLFASKGCGSADVCILGNLVAWDNALLAWARFLFFFLSPPALRFAGGED